MYVHCTDDGPTAQTIGKFVEALKTLSYSSNVFILTKDQKAPLGCAVAIVNDRCDANLMLKVCEICVEIDWT